MKTVNRRMKIASGSALAVAGAVLGSAGQSEAAVVYSGVLNLVVADTTTDGSGTGFNLPIGGGAFDLGLAHGVGSTNASTGYAFFGDIFANAIPGVEVAGFTAGAYNYAYNVIPNYNIADIPSSAFLAAGAVGTLAFNGGYGNDQFLDAGEALMVFKFGSTNYGWVRLDMSGSPLNSFTIVDFAYTTAGEELLSGSTDFVAIPEPSSLGALALGAVGLMRWRGSRKVA